LEAVMTSAERTQVRVLHQDPLVLAGLVAVLRQHSEFVVSGTDDAQQAISAEPDRVVVADYSQALKLTTAPLPDAICRSTRRPHILVVADTGREHEVREALQAGAHGYVLTNSGIDEIIAGVKSVARGTRYLCNRVAQRLADSLSHETLTSREWEVLRLLAEGLGNKAIAECLGIALGTVKAHVKTVLDKLEAETRTQALAIANQRGLLAHTTSR
jgi:DNA-binding NarL/FixJ family response regulator